MNALAQVASVFSTLVFFPLIVQAFGLGEYGVYVIATSAAGFVLMFDLGIGVSTVRLVASKLHAADLKGFAEITSTSLLLLTLLGVLFAGLVAGLAFVSSMVFNVTSEQADLLRRLLFIAAGTQLLWWPSSLAVHALNGLERYDLTARASVASTIASVAAIGVVLFTESGPVVLMALGAVVVGITGLVNLTALFRAKPAGRLFGVPRLAVAKEIVAGGVPVFAVSVAQFLNKEQIDRLVIAVFIGPAAVVVYEVAAKLSMLITQVAGLPTSALLPVVSGMVARRDAAGVRSLFLDGGRYVTLLVAPVVITLAALAGPFISVWFGGQMQSSTSIAHLLILTQLFFVPLLVGDPILTGTGRIKLWVRWAGVVALTNLGLSIILVRSMGPTGVALATMVASLVELPLFASLILRELDIPVREWFGSVWRAYALLPLPALLALGLARTALGSSLLGLLVCGGASLLAYWCFAWWWALAAEERATVLSRVHRPS